jgi:1,4-dihydroxy-2-naphthoate octaprenyltransferase
MNAAKKWVTVMRLATIPLALSSIGLGSFLVAFLKTPQWNASSN